MFCILSALLLLLESYIFAYFFKFIAFPMILMILNPISHTDPTELVLARLAPHIVAATIFLDCLSALGTLLGVGKNPCSILWFSILFYSPLVLQVADAWLVNFIPTLKTGYLATEASATLVLRIVLNLKTVLASFTTAPSDQSIVIGERLKQIEPIPIQCDRMLIQYP